MTPAELEAVRARLRTAATLHDGGYTHWASVIVCGDEAAEVRAPTQEQADAIALSWRDIAALLAEVDRLRAELEAAREDRDNHAEEADAWRARVARIGQALGMSEPAGGWRDLDSAGGAAVERQAEAAREVVEAARWVPEHDFGCPCRGRVPYTECTCEVSRSDIGRALASYDAARGQEG
jgi:hypothetical protein